MRLLPAALVSWLHVFLAAALPEVGAPQLVLGEPPEGEFKVDPLARMSSFSSLAPPHPPGPTLPTPRPLVLWHGLGDTYNSAGILEFIEEIKGIHEGIFVHSIYLDIDPSKDQKAGWFGKVNEQIEVVYDELNGIEELKGGFDAMGFSQGGQFLRGYVERFNSPPVHNLITFGSQHMGVSDLPGCKPTDFLCKAAKFAIKGGVYSAWAQNSVVQAQYFRDPANYGAYLAQSAFLADINNEIPVPLDDEDPKSRNATYKANLSTLSNLVLVLFDQDKTVVPRESAWFGSLPIIVPEPIRYPFLSLFSRWWTLFYTKILGDEEPGIVTMVEQPLYKEDWIGLKTLDEANRVFLKTCVGEHMQMANDCWEPIVKEFCGSREVDAIVDDIVDDPIMEDIEDGWVMVSDWLTSDW